MHASRDMLPLLSVLCSPEQLSQVISAEGELPRNRVSWLLGLLTVRVPAEPASSESRPQVENERPRIVRPIQRPHSVELGYGVAEHIHSHARTHTAHKIPGAVEK